jgi:hypothetical protein
MHGLFASTHARDSEFCQKAASAPRLCRNRFGSGYWLDEVVGESDQAVVGAVARKNQNRQIKKNTIIEKKKTTQTSNRTKAIAFLASASFGRRKVAA